MKILIILIFVLTLYGCYYDNSEALYGNQGGTCDTTSVTYTLNILPILETYCYVCHSAQLVAEGGGGGYNLQDISVLQTLANNGHLYGAVSHATGYSPMPKYGNILSNCDISTFRIWINNGALNN